MKIAVVGTGYVGLVTGACFADLGHDVICVDVDEEKVAKLSGGAVPIYEPGLEDVVTRGTEAGRLRFTTELGAAVVPSTFVFICVPTPPLEDGGADLSHVEDAARSIVRHITGYKVIINKSTIPVGTTLRVEKVVRERLPAQIEFDFASNPEFLREGSAVFDFMHPDRVVIGTRSEKAAGLLTDLYRPLGAPLIVTDPETAEMIKYASNAFLATKISFINAIANICDATGADVKEVALGMGYDARIGFEFLKPGPGFGGSCFPKDCKALVRVADEGGYDFHLLRGVLEVNEEQHRVIARKVEKVAGGVAGKRIAAWGLAFKPNTDDVRESPAIAVIRLLVEGGATVVAYDPAAADAGYAVVPGLERAPGAYEAVRGADCAVLLTEWNEFRWLDFERVKQVMAMPKIVDARNFLDAHTLRQMGFVYEGVGR